jgi:hypothetical protein
MESAAKTRQGRALKSAETSRVCNTLFFIEEAMGSIEEEVVPSYHFRDQSKFSLNLKLDFISSFTF